MYAYSINNEPLAIFPPNEASIKGLVFALAILDVHNNFGLFTHLSDLLIRVPFAFFVFRFHFAKLSVVSN